MGSIVIFLYGTCFHQQRSIQGSVSACLWGGGAFAVLPVPFPEKETVYGFLGVSVCLFYSGISYRLFSGTALGLEMVGLQRTFPESAWKDMSGGSGALWLGRDGTNLFLPAVL